jgi:PBSX family phage terminase large subunit
MNNSPNDEILKLSQKQYDSLMAPKKRFNIWIGAVRSGKSYSSLICFEDFCKNGPPGDFAVIGQSIDAIKRNVIAPLTDMMGDRMSVSIGNRIAHLYNRKIHLIGANDERAERKIRGCTLAGAYVDEITILPEVVWNTLNYRLSLPGAKLFGTTNPDSPFHWLKKKWIDLADDLDIQTWNFTLEDNPSLDPIFVANLRKGYKGLWYERFIEGRWVLAEGTIFDFFDRSLHVIDFPPGIAEYYIVGVDYGTTNPTAFSLIGYSSKTYPNRWLEKEYYWDSKKTLRQKTDTEYAEDLQKFIKNYPQVRAIYIDPSAVSFRVELRRQGFNGVIEAQNEVLDGIRYHSIQLSNGTFKVCRNCTKSIEEYGTYRWDAKASAHGEDKPLKENDHLMDSIRYALYSEWFQKEGPRMTAEDVERLRREAQGGDMGHGKFFDDKMW